MHLSWDDISSRFYKVGLDHGVLYLYNDEAYTSGVAWNGLSSIEDSSSGHEKELLYTADFRSNILFTPKEFGGSIKCYTYPDEFEECIGNEEIAPGLFAEESDGSMFGLSYRTKIGSSVDPNFAYELHLIYGAYVTEAKDSAATIGENVNVGAMSFSFECIGEEFEGHDPCAHFKIDSRRVPKDQMDTIEAILYGTDETDPRLPLPDELLEILAAPIEPAEYEGYPDERVFPENSIFPEQPIAEEEP